MSMSDARRVVRDGYDVIAPRYLDERVPGGDMDLLPELVSRLDAGDTVLDAGCGAGVPVMPDLCRAGLLAIGLDVSRTQLELARSLNESVGLVQADLGALPFRDTSFAGIVSFYAVIHVPRSEHPSIFRELWRVLRSGGIALICLGARDHPDDDDPDSWLGAPMFWSHFDAETNLELLREARFEILRDEIVPDPMSHGRHLFALVRRSTSPPEPSCHPRRVRSSAAQDGDDDHGGAGRRSEPCGGACGLARDARVETSPTPVVDEIDFVVLRAHGDGDGDGARRRTSR